MIQLWHRLRWAWQLALGDPKAQAGLEEAMAALADKSGCRDLVLRGYEYVSKLQVPEAPRMNPCDMDGCRENASGCYTRLVVRFVHDHRHVCTEHGDLIEGIREEVTRDYFSLVKRRVEKGGKPPQ